jgi:hypothetical protein
MLYLRYKSKFSKLIDLNISITTEGLLQEYSEVKKNQKIIKKHGDAYSIGRYSNVDNSYPLNSEKRKAFDFGRLAKLTMEKHNNDRR